jgi:ATP-dependent Clp protease ATP-binding subunit ClpA
MFNRFSEHSKTAMMRAREEALRLRHDSIGTEHMLLALIQESSSLAARVLTGMNVDLETIRPEVARLAKAGPSEVAAGQLPFTPRAKKVLELAMAEASALGHDYIGSEHLLLGLIAEREGIAAQVLASFGVKLEIAREEVRRLAPPTLAITKRLSEAFVHAQEHSRAQRQSQVTTVNMLIGLLQEPGGLAARVLSHLGVKVEDVEKEAAQLLGPSGRPESEDG